MVAVCLELLLLWGITDRAAAHNNHNTYSNWLVGHKTQVKVEMVEYDRNQLEKFTGIKLSQAVLKLTRIYIKLHNYDIFISNENR